MPSPLRTSSASWLPKALSPGFEKRASGTSTLRNACEPCRTRKVKCTGEKPVCTRCTRMSKNCIYLPNLTGPIHQSVSQLQGKIKRLEALLGAQPRSTPDTSSDAIEASAQGNLLRGERTETTPPPMIATPCSAQSWAADPNPSADACVGSEVLNSLQDGLDDARQILLSPDGQLASSIPITGEVLGSLDIRGRRMQTQQFSSVEFAMIPPSDKWIELLDHFCYRTGGFYPIAHLPTILSQYEAIASGKPSVQAWDLSIVMMVVAVASVSLSTHSSLYEEWKPLARRYYEYAISVQPSVDEDGGLNRLQLLLLQLQFISYQPSLGSIWDTVHAASTLAVALGLHREPKDVAREGMSSALDLDMRRRLFWITYNLERNISFTLERPTALPDSWITTPYPSAVDDSNITDSGITSDELSPLKLTALHAITLRKLQSEIHETLYSPAATEPPPREWYQSMEECLKEWRSAVIVNPRFAGESWANAKVYLTQFMLYRPSPCHPLPDRNGLSTSIKSAGSLMRAYQGLYRAGTLTCNWFSLYQLFVADVTYLNCLHLAQSSGWTIIDDYQSHYLDLQASTSVMEGIAAMIPGTHRIRDASQAVVQHCIKLLASSLVSSLSATQPSGRDPRRTRSLAEASGVSNTGDLPSLGTFFAQPLAFTPAGEWEQLLGDELFDFSALDDR